jgi:Spy/CpxP family protein refolding chaperone
MNPDFYSWWKHARENLRGAHAEMHPCGPGDRGGRGHRRERGFYPGMHPGAQFGGFGGPFDHGGDAGPFGVRRPLRFLAHKLDLDEKQTEELARIIEALKTERAQAEVDHRRTIASFADAIEQDAFAEDKAREGGELRVKSAEKVREAVLTALSKIHAMLDPDQRKRFAYLIRTGIVSL